MLGALALLLMFGLTVRQVTHFRHYWEEAAAHADHDADHEHDERECALVHAGLIVEASFDFPVPEGATASVGLAGTLQRPVPPDLCAHAPRAPPATS